MRSCTLLILFISATLVAAGIPPPVRPCVSHKPFRMFAQEALPGFSTAFSQNGLDYFRGVGLQLLSQKLKNLTIPNINGERPISIIGNIQYNVSQIALASVNFDASNIVIVPGVGLSITVDKASANGVLHWHWQQNSFPHLHGTGLANFSTALSMSMKLTFQAVNNHLQLDTVNPVVVIDDLSVEITGTSGWFYNFLLDILGPFLKNQIADQLEKAVGNQVETQLNKLLMSVPVRQTVKTPLVFDIGLLSNPEFSTDSFRLFESGASYDMYQPTECPADVCPQRKLPDTTTQRMAQVYVADYVGNSMGYAAHQSGLINFFVTPEMVPANVPFKLNTSSLAFLPELAAKYPNAPVYLNISGNHPPHVVFDTTGATFTIPLKIDFLVEAPEGRILAVTAEGEVTAPATVHTNGSIIYPQIGRLPVPKWNVTYSSIGEFNTKPLYGALKFVTSALVGGVNDKVKNGVSLPTVQGLEFVNPTLTWSEGFMSVEVDFVFHPSA